MGTIIKAFLFMAGIGIIITLISYFNDIVNVINDFTDAINFGPYTWLLSIGPLLIIVIGVWRLING